MTGFIFGLVVAGAAWGWLTLRRRLNHPYPGGPASTVRQFGHTSATASPHMTVNIQTVDPAQLAAMASILASAAAAGHTTIPVPSARALEIEADKMLAITARQPLPGAAAPGTPAPPHARQRRATGPGSHCHLRSTPGRSEHGTQSQ
jgi:hypothetical protein